MSIQRLEINRTLRGHDFFGSELENTPGFYETEDIDADDKVVTAHYFLGGSHWYVCEFDHKANQIFGWAVLNGDMVNAEWGYSSLFELEAVTVDSFGMPMVIQRDLHWKPKQFRDIQR